MLRNAGLFTYAAALLTSVCKIRIIASVFVGVPKSAQLFRGSAAVAQLTVNQLVAGSNPAPGAMKLSTI